MSAPSPQYEFSEQQNALIGSLASKMGVVGLFFLVVGVIQILMALVVVLAIYRDRIPPDWVNRSKEYVQQLPDDVRKEAEQFYSPDRLPSNNHLWGIAINSGVIGLFYLLLGSWTRSAAASFQRIVSTQGRDISHLMSALDALHSMYALVYTLLMITLILILILLGMSLWARFGG